MSTPKPTPLFPDLPTIAAAGGLQGYEIRSSNGLLAPAKTPPAILDKIAKTTQEAMKSPKWEEALTRDGLEMPPDRTRAEFAKMVADEHAFWGKKLKELKVDME